MGGGGGREPTSRHVRIYPFHPEVRVGISYSVNIQAHKILTNTIFWGLLLHLGRRILGHNFKIPTSN